MWHIWDVILQVYSIVSLDKGSIFWPMGGGVILLCVNCCLLREALHAHADSS